MRRRWLFRRLTLWLPPVFYMAFIFYLSAQSNPLPIVTQNVWDKLLHSGAYSVLGWLLTRAFIGDGRGWRAAVLTAIVLTSAYGVTDEYHQSFVPNRASDVHDWLADTLGGAIGAGAFALWQSRASVRLDVGGVDLD